MKKVLILLAKAAIAAPALAGMERLRAAVAKVLPDWHVDWAFSEQGSPPLREKLDAHAAAAHLRILPLSLPAEPAAQVAIARRA